MRRKDWYERLTNFVTTNVDRNFEWGTWDCCLFSSSCIYEMTGEDPAESFRGTYTTERGALRALKKQGCNSVKQVLDLKLGKGKPRLSAQRGDIALVARPAGDAAGVVYGAVILVVTPTGMQQIPLSEAKTIWSVN